MLPALLNEGFLPRSASIRNSTIPPFLQLQNREYNLFFSCFLQEFSYKRDISRNEGLIMPRRKKRGRPKGSKNSPKAVSNSTGSEITVEDIQAVKALTERMGTEKIQALAKVLAK